MKNAKLKNKPLEAHISIETERAILSALLEDSFAYAKISGILSIDSFAVEAHKEIYAACVELSSLNEPIDARTVFGKTIAKDSVREIGGLKYLLELSAESNNAMNVESHAKVLNQYQVWRNAYDYGLALTEKATKLQDPFKIIDFAKESAENITKSIGLKKLINFKDQINETFEEFYRNYELRQTGGISGVTSGYETIDTITGGWQGGELIVVGARPSMGKTAFVLGTAYKIAKQTNKNVVIFSYEAKAKLLISRMVSQQFSVSSGALRKGVLSKQQIEFYHAKAAEELGSVKILINDEIGIPIESYIAKLKEYTLQHGEIGAVIVDYLGLVPTSKLGNTNDKVAHISRTLKTVAMEFDVPVFALSQLSRGLEHREDKRPSLADLRDSGAVEQDADAVLFIHRPEYYQEPQLFNGEPSAGKAEIILSKFRAGERNQTVVLGFEGKYLSFYDLATETEMTQSTDNYIRNESLKQGGTDFF